MKFRILQWVAIVLILVTGYLHFITIPEEYAEAPYMGWLFFANGVGALVAAVGIFRQKIWWGWMLGLLIAAGSVYGYIQSRTIGMPGMEVEPWPDMVGIANLASGGKSLLSSASDICGVIYSESTNSSDTFGLIGFVAMIVEIWFVGMLVLAKPWNVPGMDVQFAGFNHTFKRVSTNRFFYPAMMVTMLLIGVFSYRLGVQNAAAKHESKHPIPDTVISAQTLEEKYGVQMTLVAVTAAGGLVDIRYKITDPEKAALLATEEEGIMPMIYIENGDYLLMPDMNMRTKKLVADRMYFSLIPNAQNAVKRGASVVVIFKDIALEPMITQ